MEIAATPCPSNVSTPHFAQPLFQPPVRSRLPYLCTIDADDCLSANRQTCIICTIGPSCNTVEKLTEMLIAGMTIARLDFSHGTHEQHLATVQAVRNAYKAYAALCPLAPPLAISADTKGPEIRTGNMDKRTAQTVYLAVGQPFRLTIVREHAEKGTVKMIYVDYENIVNVVTAGERIYLDDGLIALRIDSVGADTITTTVVIGGTLSNNKTVNLQTGTPADLPTISEKDRADLRFAVEHDFDVIFVSGVRTAGILADVRKQLGERGKHIALVAKVETREALRSLADIVRAADGVMFWRCGLSMEMSGVQVCLAQKAVLAVCRMEAKPVFCGTQILAAPFHNEERARRVDQWDISDAVVDGADGILLSGATAVREHPVQSVRIAHMTCLYAEATLCQAEVLRDLEPRWRVDAVQAMVYATVRMAWRLQVRCIVVVSALGGTAQMVARLRPRACIVAVVRSARVARRMRLFWGVLPTVFAGTEEWGSMAGDEKRAAFGVAYSRSMGVAGRDGDGVVVLSDVKNGPQCAARIVVLGAE